MMTLEETRREIDELDSHIIGLLGRTEANW